MNTQVQRFVKLDDAGIELPVDAANWSQVLDRQIVIDQGLQTQRIWTADPLDRDAWKKAIAAAAAHDLGGFTWRAPDIREQLSIVDYERFDPAFDPTFLRGDAGGYWTSTRDASSPSDYAWVVASYDGDSHLGYQDHRLWVRPVRSVVLPGQ